LEILSASDSDVTGVQIDRVLRTWNDESQQRDFATCAYGGLASDTAVNTIRDVNPSLVFQATSAVRSERSLQALTDIQWATGVPFFIDLDLDETWLTARDMRRGLLGAKWLRIKAADLPAMNRPSATYKGRQPELLTAAQSVRSAFALETVIVDHHGLPTLIVAGTQVVQGGRRWQEPRGSSAQQRAQVAAAALVAGVISGLSVRELLRRATNQALAFTGAPAGGCAASSSTGCAEGMWPQAAGEGIRK
jgi:hypothetical protein